MSVPTGKAMAAATYIGQGENAIGRTPEARIATILGSCVAACIWDPVTHIGGMNHFLLPGTVGTQITSNSFGAHAMEVLINALIRAGADRRRFHAKLFGGATMISGLSDAGAQNAQFAQDYLERENIVCDGKSLGGNRARRVEFWPWDGTARQKRLSDTHVVETPAVNLPTNGTDLELF